jgi:ABC-2 type transport system permease protein
MSVTTLTRNGPRTMLWRLTFPRVVTSEWIKLRSVRSTFWTYAVVLALGVGISALASLSVPASITDPMSAASKSSFMMTAASFGLYVGQLAVAVLGVLAISGEYSTGMIRSSFAAVPRRTPVLLAKSTVLFASSFIVGVVTILAGYAIAAPVLSGKGFTPDLTDAGTIWSILGGGLYLGLVAVFALGLGTLLRSAAGGIAAALGALLLLPVIANLVFSFTGIEWIGRAPQYFLNSAGQAMAGASSPLEPWQNMAVALVWAAVPFILGLVVVKRRDA